MSRRSVGAGLVAGGCSWLQQQALSVLPAHSKRGFQAYVVSKLTCNQQQLLPSWNGQPEPMIIALLAS
jgi:hypothetical protein